MAGHSHWAKVKRAKASVDAKRGQLWSKLSRRIIVAAKGGGNPDDNLSLRYAIDEARAANMPNDTIERAIKKGTGELGGQAYETVMYEGFGPGGVAMLVECLTNNRSRTAPELRTIFDRRGGQLGGANSVAWMFEPKGVFIIASDAIDEDSLMEIALEAGAQDIQTQEGVFEVTCEVPQYNAVKETLQAKNVPTLSARLTMVPTTTVQVEGDVARHVLGLVDALEENDDVQNVYANYEMPDDILEEQ